MSRQNYKQRRAIPSFENYINESEATSVPFTISERLEKLLQNINHPIADRLIKDSRYNSNNPSPNATALDYDDINMDMLTYIIPSKLIKNIAVPGNSNDKFILYRKLTLDRAMFKNLSSPIRIGKLINKIYRDEYKSSGENSLEGFVDSIKLERNRTYDNFEIVKGDDIIKYYNLSSFASAALKGTNLGNSCMAGDDKKALIEFFAINDVSMLILKSENEPDKIVGRALIWDIAEVDDKKKVDIKYMDRVYYVDYYEKELFVELAIRNKWYYKTKNAGKPNNNIWNPNTNDVGVVNLKTKSSFIENPNGLYPYMDTMKWFYVDDKFLSNTMKYIHNNITVLHLEDDKGNPTIEPNKGKWLDYYNDFVEEELLTYCELGDDFRIKEDALFIKSVGKNATAEYIEEFGYYDKDERGYDLNSNR